VGVGGGRVVAGVVGICGVQMADRSPSGPGKFSAEDADELPGLPVLLNCSNICRWLALQIWHAVPDYLLPLVIKANQSKCQQLASGFN